jgi:serine/threonine protein kinase
MGEVYRATDTNLKRSVAIKVLPASVAADAERLARFRREAEVLAALNHPNIAHIHGMEESGGITALVMELVEGDDLSQRIARGALPSDEALPIAKQIAQALEAAHEQGIIHRDLKPANIKVRDDGTVKVLDFGLAKMLDPTSPSPGLSLSPTIVSPGVTNAGIILGTAAYMSPEQARGKTVDKRSDIWAFGCVLYEMLTGTRAFTGDEITDVIAAVVRDEPDWSRLPADTPAAIRRLLRRALNKDRKQRLADIADVRLELDDPAVAEPGHDAMAATSKPFRRRELAWAAVAIASLLAAAVLGLREFRAPSEARIVRFDIAPPAGGAFDWGQPLSPDGRTLAYIATVEGKSQIWVRPLDSTTPRSLPGTEGATRSFWSPDSQHIAFFVDGNLKTVEVTGGPPKLIANGPFRDGAWSTGGTILVGGQLGRPLLRVSELGGEPVAETTLDPSVSEASHDYPEFLADGRHYIYMARRGVRANEFVTYVGTLGSKERRELSGIRSAVKYSPTGHLLFLRGTTLMAQSFSRDRLELSGDAFPVAEQVGGTRVSTYSVAENGTLAFVGAPSAEVQLTWMDQTGKRLGVVGATGVYDSPAISPDGRFVAFGRGSPSNIWVLDLNRAAASRITTDRSDDRFPIWSPNGQSIAFASTRAGKDGLYERSVGNAGDDRLLIQNDLPMLLSDWSRDGKYLVYSVGGDLWALPLADTGKPLQLTASPFYQEYDAVFSPDGRWIAYGSDESSGITRSGQGDVFVQSFPERTFTRQVSTNGGFTPRWSSDGKQLFYVSPDGAMMAVSLTAQGSMLDIGAPRSLFPVRIGPAATARSRFSVASDGRFLMRVGASENSLTVILNWFEHLNRGRPAN